MGSLDQGVAGLDGEWDLVVGVRCNAVGRQRDQARLWGGAGDDGEDVEEGRRADIWRVDNEAFRQSKLRGPT